MRLYTGVRMSVFLSGLAVTKTARGVGIEEADITYHGDVSGFAVEGPIGAGGAKHAHGDGRVHGVAQLRV